MTKLIPRPYQLEAFEALKKDFIKYDNLILSLPTGSGKTYVACQWIYDNFLTKNKRVAWVAHRIELLRQAYSTFKKILPIHNNLSFAWWTGAQKQHAGDILLTSAQSTSKLPTVNYDLVVIDEAHHEQAPIYQDLLAKIHYKKHLGLTATPTRLDKKKLGYDKISYQKTFIELVHEGWLAKPLPVIPSTRMAYNMSESQDDFDDQSLEQLNTPERNNFIVQHYIDHKFKYKKTILFAINKEHAKKLKDNFTLSDKTVSVECVLSDEMSSDQRKTIIKRFSDGEIDILINCRIFTEGFDCPDIQTVMLTRPTLSVTLYLQMIGRGTRTTSDKKDFYLVDFKDDLGKFENRLITPWNFDEEYEDRCSFSGNRIFAKSNLIPKFLLESTGIEPINLNLIDGYCTYKTSSNRTEGFLIYKEDKENFNKLLETLSQIKNSDFDSCIKRTLAFYNTEKFKNISVDQAVTVANSLVNGNFIYTNLDS